jgi:hypothetical protein
MSDRGLWLQLLVVGLAVLSLSVAGAGTALGSEQVQHTEQTNTTVSAALADGASGADATVTTAAAEPSQTETVVDFNWPFPNCPDQGTSQLGTYFSGDIGSSDDNFHVDNGDGANNAPSGECFLRTNAASAEIESIPGQQSENLDYYPERGDEVSFQHYFNRIGAPIPFVDPDGTDYEFRFGMQDAQNYYYLLLGANNEPLELRLGKVVDGNRQLLDSSGLDVRQGEFFPVEIRWGTGNTPDTIEAEFDDENVVSATDTTFDEGGIGFYRTGTTGDDPIFGVNVLSYANLIDTVDATVAPPNFQIDITDTGGPVAPGETAQITAEIENVGGLDQTETVNFNVDGQTVDSTEVSLDSGYAGNYDSTTVTFGYTADEQDAPFADIAVCPTESGSCGTDRLDVLTPASFSVAITGVNSPTEGESLDVTTEVTNAGDLEDTGTVELSVPGVGSTTETITVNGRTTTTETISLSTGAGDAGTYTATVDTGGDSDSRTVTIGKQATFDVDIPATNSPEEGDDLEVTVQVTNTGDEPGSQTITLDVPGLGSDSTTVSLSTVDTTTRTLSVPTASGDAGDYTATVASDDDTVSASVAVLEPGGGSGVFEVGIATTNSPVTAGNGLNVAANVTNTGAESATKTVTLDVPGLGSDSETLALDSGESILQELSVSTDAGDGGEYTATVETPDNTATQSVTVRSLPNFGVEIIDATEPVAGADLSVTAEVTNTGDLSDIQTLNLSVPGIGSRTTGISLDGGNSTTETIAVPTDTDDAGTYTATMSTEDDSASTGLTVTEPANLTVQIGSANSPVESGDLSVTAILVNEGETAANQTVELDAQGLGTDTTSVSLAPGDSTTATLSVATGPGDAGSYTATVSSANDSAATPVTVFEPANFGVAIDGTNQPFEGEDIEVTATVTNTGGVSDTQTVELDVPGLGTNATAVSLAPGNSTTRTFSIPTSVGDGMEYVFTVASNNESALGTIDLRELATFDVNITNATQPVEGEDLEVTTNITNTGDQSGTQTVELNVSGLGTDTTSLSLDPGASTVTTLSVPTGPGDAGRYRTTVTSDNDTVGVFTTVRAPDNFTVDITDTTTPIEGDNLTVTTTVTNVGEVAGTQTLTLDVPGVGTSTTQVSLASNESTTTTLSLATGDGDAGDYTATVQSGNETATTPVTILDQSAFTVAITDTTDPVEGDDIVVNATVTNAGEVAGTQAVSLDVPGVGTDTTQVSLNGSESTTETFTLPTVRGDNGTYTATVATANDTASTGLTVLAEAAFDVSITDASDVFVGDRLSVTADVTNVGNLSDTQTVELSVPGVGTNATTVSLNGTESTTATLSVATGAGDAGDYSVSVTSANDTATASVSVLERASFDVSITDAADVVAGENLSVGAVVTNTGDVSDTQTVELDAGALGTNTTTLSLAGGNSTVLTLSVPTSQGDAGTYTTTVTTDNDTASADVDVLEAGSVTVQITNVTERLAGNDLELNVTLENTGGATETQTLALDIPGLASESRTVTLAGGNSTVEQFVIPTSQGDAGDYTATVTGADDSASTTVTVLQEAFFALEVLERGQPVEGEDLNVTVGVTNTGDFSDTQSVDVSLQTGDFGSKSITLAAGESTTRTYSFATSAGDAGSYDMVVLSDDESVDSSVTILQQDAFNFQIDNLTDAAEGSPLRVNLSVKNTADSSDSDTITFDVPGLGSNSTTVSLAGGASTSETLSIPTSAGDAGSYSANVFSSTASRTVSVAVLEPPEFEVTITGTNGPVGGQLLSVTANVTNVGEVSDTQSITLDVPGLGSDSTTVTVDGGLTKTTTISVATTRDDIGEYTATVASANDTASTPVTVRKPATFLVEITDAPDTVEGENATVTANVTNTGDVSGTQTVELDAGPLGTNTTTLSLASGATTTETLSVPTSAGDSGTYTATVASANDTASTGLQVLEPANFTVEITDTSEAVEGDNLSVTAGVTNVGGASATKTVSLDIPGLGSNSTQVSLAGGSTTTETLSVPTGDGDAGEYTATVQSDGDTASSQVSVLAPANFSVTLADTADPVEGETLSVTVDVTNVGDVAGTQTVTLDVPGLGSDSTSVSLGSTESTTATLSLGTGAGDAGDYTATVQSDNDTASASVSVLEPANFSVALDSTTDPVEGENATVTATVENVGDVAGTQTVALDVPGLGTNSTTLSLPSGDSTTETLAVGTGAGDAGDYTATVQSDNDTASAGLTVLAPAEFTVEITGTTDAVEGENATVTANITNVGDATDTQTVTVDVAGLGTATTQVTLAGGANTTETLAVGTGSGDADSYTATVSTADDSASTSLQVLAPANFSVEITDVSDAVEGEPLSVTATVTNVGDVSGTQTVELDVPGLGTNTTTVSLASTGSTTVDLSLQTSADDTGSYTATVASTNDTASVPVSVLAEGTLAVEIVDISDPLEGTNLTVEARVENTGDVSASQTLTLDVSGLGTASTQVTLAGSATTTETLSVGTSEGDAGEYTATVSTADASASTTVTVFEPANFTVEITDITEPVEGENLTVTAKITNTGDATDTQTVALGVAGVGSDSTQVSLASGGTTTVILSTATANGDAGDYTATVSTADDTATASVSVLADALFNIDIVNVSEPVQGDPVNVTVQVTNLGDILGVQTVGLELGLLGSDSTELSLGLGSTTNVTLSVPTSQGDYGTYTLNVSTLDDEVSAQTEVLLPTLVDGPPQDLDDDGLYEDVRGNGGLSILDVQSLFNNLENEVVQNNSEAFKFQPGVGEITILDVQGLFNELQETS